MLFLLGYMPVAVLAFKLVHCVDMGSSSRLFYGGEVRLPGCSVGLSVFGLCLGWPVFGLAFALPVLCLCFACALCA